MSKDINNCDKLIEDNNICPPIEANQQTTNQSIENSQPIKKGILKWIISALAIVALAAVALVVYNVSNSDSYEKAIERLVKMEINMVDSGNMIYDGLNKDIKNLAPEEYWNFFEKENGMTIDRIIDKLNKDSFDMNVPSEYKGKELKYEITQSRHLSKNEVKNISNAINEEYSITSVNDAYNISAVIYFNSPDDDDADKLDAYVIEIKNKWYIAAKNGHTYSFFVGAIGEQMLEDVQ